MKSCFSQTISLSYDEDHIQFDPENNEKFDCIIESSITENTLTINFQGDIGIGETNEKVMENFQKQQLLKM